MPSKKLQNFLVCSLILNIDVFQLVLVLGRDKEAGHVVHVQNRYLKYIGNKLNEYRAIRATKALNADGGRYSYTSFQ
jgi:hypothetical protein